MLLGTSGASTIHKETIDDDVCANDLYVLTCAMFTTLVSASCVATTKFCVLPISTTHTIIGSVAGFSIVAKGFKVRTCSGESGPDPCVYNTLNLSFPQLLLAAV